MGNCAGCATKIQKKKKNVAQKISQKLTRQQTSFIAKAAGFTWFYGGEQEFFLVKIGKKKLVQFYYENHEDSLTPKSVADGKVLIGRKHMKKVGKRLIKNASKQPYCVDINPDECEQLSNWEIFLLYMNCGLQRFGDFTYTLRPCRFSYSIMAPSDSDGKDMEWRMIHSGANFRQDMVSKHYMLATGKSVLLSGELFIYFESHCIPKIKQILSDNPSNFNSKDLYEILPYCHLILDNASGTYQPDDKNNRFHHMEQLLKYSFLDDQNETDSQIINYKLQNIKIRVLDRQSSELQQLKDDMLKYLDVAI